MPEFIDFPRVFNLRDLGGYTARDGRTVRSGVLFRSDNLGGLTDADRERFGALGVRTVIDLRQPEEIERFLGRAPAWSCEVWHNIAMANPTWSDKPYSEADGPAAFLVARYHEMAKVAGADIVQVLGILADPATGPVAVHCLGGRDRTGIVMAFVLDLLGVPDDVIAADYHFTELATQRFMAWFRVLKPDAAELAPYLTVTPAVVILTVLRELREEYGSVAGYLTAHGLTQAHIASLRALYLE